MYFSNTTEKETFVVCYVKKGNFPVFAPKVSLVIHKEITSKYFLKMHVRPLSVSFFIEKEPHKQLRMKRKRKGER
jgi:hypothetical protein